ncbi:hypothetical protein O181_067390 [Austropuccinia psidii MF-1]|uniref:Tc1-like transposase DDE domain-containing protein n=1 Tax=Austropuccinia psidii MF-1 TaxID=1389203 RepID=A0A9Q3EYW1_9BASI|nr:hypothetical protein [Austropuccinia psidii MF-1]
MDKLVQVGVSANRKGLTLMEYGASIHTALASQQSHPNHKIHKLFWPPNSPELNPIENLWLKMNYVVTNLFNPKTMDELSEVIHIVWDTIPFDNLEELLVSMPSRIRMFLDKNGAPT